MNSPPGCPRLYVVTDRAATAGRPLADVVRAAVAGALRGGLSPGDVAVQLREKDLPGRALRETAGVLRDITQAAGAALFVNDRVDVALAAGADGVHLSGTSLSPVEARALAPSLRLAISAHHASNLLGLGGPVDFAVFGPVRDTPSKRAYGPPVGLEALRSAAAAAGDVPLVAIGGITVGDVPSVAAAGARGVACIRALMAAADPEGAARALAQALAAVSGRPPVPRPHRT